MQPQGAKGGTPVQRRQADTVPRGGIHQPPPPPAMPQRHRCCERAQVRVLEQAGRLAGAGEVVPCIPISAISSSMTAGKHTKAATRARELHTLLVLRVQIRAFPSVPQHIKCRHAILVQTGIPRVGTARAPHSTRPTLSLLSPVLLHARVFRSQGMLSELTCLPTAATQTRVHTLRAAAKGALARQ